MIISNMAEEILEEVEEDKILEESVIFNLIGASALLKIAINKGILGTKEEVFNSVFRPKIRILNS